MRAKITRVGNSKGFILSKPIIEKYQFDKEVEIVLHEDHLILKPVKKPREGWEDSFRAQKEESPDELLIPDVFEDEEILPW